MKRNLNISIDPELYDYLQKQKKITNRNTSNLIETMLLKTLEMEGVNIHDKEQ